MRVGNLFATPERQGNLLLLLLLHFPLSTYSAAKESLSLSTSPSWMSKYFINNSNAVLGPAKNIKSSLHLEADCGVRRLPAVTVCMQSGQQISGRTRLASTCNWKDAAAAAEALLAALD